MRTQGRCYDELLDAEKRSKSVTPHTSQTAMAQHAHLSPPFPYRFMEDDLTHFMCSVRSMEGIWRAQHKAENPDLILNVYIFMLQCFG